MTLDEAVTLVLEPLAPIAEPALERLRSDRFIETGQ